MSAGLSMIPSVCRVNDSNPIICWLHTAAKDESYKSICSSLSLLCNQPNKLLLSVIKECSGGAYTVSNISAQTPAPKYSVSPVGSLHSLQPTIFRMLVYIDALKP